MLVAISLPVIFLETDFSANLFLCHSFNNRGSVGHNFYLFYRENMPSPYVVINKRGVGSAIRHGFQAVLKKNWLIKF